MHRLSRSIADLKVHYDAVVVGSGYGGGVAASRLARAGKRVAVLERGQEFALGEFPDRLMEAHEQLQVTVGGTHTGSRLGLFDLRLGKDMNVLVGCGLGGTSLINANVSLPPDPRVWDDPVWPAEIRRDETRQEGYTRARAMLAPVPYPGDTPLIKLDAFKTQASALGREAVRPPINVTFTRRINDAGVEQPACTLCGDCCAGCNVGAKNTVQMTYLPDAASHGAEIFTGVRVTHVVRERGRWRVYFEPVGNERDKFAAPEQSISAEVVVLAAGTLGSTEILLRSREKGLKVSERLGERFTGNGDMLAFAYNNDVPINGIGVGHPPTAETEPVGPCIAGLIDLRDTEKLEDGIVIEEGSIPSGLASILPAALAAGALAFGEDTDPGILDGLSESARQHQSLVFGAYRGAVRNTQTFLVMAHDNAAGRMALDDDGDMKIEWPGVASQPLYETIHARLKAATAATGGTYTKLPVFTSPLGSTLITVHPLGGCGMGADRSRGVVDHKCRVFDADPTAMSDAVHKGLYVCDGAIVPRPLGVNPLLTITALAERAMIHLAKDYGWTFDVAPRKEAPKAVIDVPAAAEPKPAGVEFTERMSGFISPNPLLPHDTAAALGKSSGQELSFTVTVLVDDVAGFIVDRQRKGRIVGTVDCPSLSPEPLEIFDGQFNLMRADEGSVETKRFDYRFSLAARDGAEYRFEGFKVVRADPRFDLWADTTRLYVDIAKGATGQLGPFARGVLQIKLADFATQMRTIRGTGGRNGAERLEAVGRFGRFFAGQLYDTYGGVLAPTKRYDVSAPRKKRKLRVGEPEIHVAMTADGKALRLTRYAGGKKGPLLFSHGLGVSSLIFSIDTIETNLLEYLYAAGYDCWLLDYRASVDLPYAREQWTGDDVATRDYPAAVAKVRAETGAPSVQVLAHCFGATTFSMAMLAGLEGVRSAVISQIFTDYIVPFFPQRMLAYLRAPALFDAIGLDVVNARATTADGFMERALDRMLRLVVPVPPKERTHSAVSTRISALYGRLYQIDQLNSATFDSGLAEMFGEANIAAFRQLALFARARHVLDARGKDVYLPHVKRLAIPITFIHGAENACFRPESTALARQRLSAVNSPDLYERHIIPAHGHIDCIFGKNAAAAVYPIILRSLERTALAP